MDFMTIPLPRERDQVLMEIFLAEDLSPESIRSLGRCRGALEAIFLSDITTADGRYLKKFVFHPGCKKSRSKYKFPKEKPSKRIGTHGVSSGITLLRQETNKKFHWVIGYIQHIAYGIGTIERRETVYNDSKKAQYTTTDC